MIKSKMCDLGSDDIVVFSGGYNQDIRKAVRTLVRDLNQQNLKPFLISDEPYTFYPCPNYTLLFNDRIDSIADYQRVDYDVLLVCVLIEYAHYNIEEIISSLKAKNLSKPVVLFISCVQENKLVREDEAITNMEKYLSVADKVFFFFNASYKHFDAIYHLIDVKTKKLLSQWERDDSRYFYLNDGFFIEYNPKDKTINDI